MLDEIRKSLLAGLGAVILTKDKIEAITRKLVEDAKLSKEDASKLARDLVETGERGWTELEGKLSESMRKGLQSLDIGSKAEVEELRAREKRLEARVKDLEKQLEELGGADEAAGSDGAADSGKADDAD